jgi:hypothetical protein
MIMVIGFFVLAGLADLRMQFTKEVESFNKLEKQLVDANKIIFDLNIKHHNSDKRYYNEIKDLIVFEELKIVRKKKKK